MNTVVLKTFDNYFSANIILTRLQHEGVNCFLRDEHTITIDPILTNALGGIKLAVDEEDAEKATALLKEYHEEYMRAAACPRCHEYKIHYVPKQNAGNFLTAIFTWLFSSYAMASEYVYECGNCGFQSATLPENPENLN